MARRPTTAWRVLVSSVVASGAATATTDGACQPFPGPASTVGFFLHDATVADLDDDGRLDVATIASFKDVFVSVGVGEGRFMIVGQYDFAGVPQEIAAVDIDDDGVLDLCVAHALGVASFLGTGGAAFAAAIELPLPTTGAQLASGDVDADGHSDLVVADDGPPALVHVLLGHGDGTFTPFSSQPMSKSANDLLLVDVDEDGLLDLVTTGLDEVLLAPGLGGGTFGPFVGTAGLAAGGECQPVDLDLDGHLDLCTGGYQTPYTDPAVLVLLGAGDGTFPGSAIYPVDLQISALASGDAQGDGLPDIALGAGDYFEGQAGLLAGSAGGLLGPVQVMPVPAFPNRVALADFTDDGLSDLLSVTESRAVVQVGDGSGAVAAASVVPLPGSYEAQQVSLFDMTGDGHLDAVVLQNGGLVWLAPGDGTGALLTATSFPSGGNEIGLALGDVDLDGQADVVTSSRVTDQVWVLLGEPDKGLAPALPFPAGDGPDDVKIADLSGDGPPDLVTANRFGDNLSILRQGPTGFSAPIPVPTGHIPFEVEVADLDVDGILDLASLNNSNSSSILLGLPDGTFALVNTVYTTHSPDDLWVSDLDQDGVPDLAIVASGNALIAYGKGDGTYRTPMSISPDGLAFDAAAVESGDVDADGDVDLVTLDGAGTCWLFEAGLAMPGPDFAAIQEFGVQSYCVDLALGDLDENGTLDVVFANWFAEALYVLLERCPPTWADLGLGLAGALGVPSLAGTGSLEPQSAVELQVSGAMPASGLILVAGFAPLVAPFKGGTLVPQPDVLLAGVTSPSGEALVAVTWPVGAPPGTVLWLQAWIADASAPQGFAASNALEATSK